ncbi:MAG: hypothetical protein ACRD3O_17300 [Terriglobia bacterium]
MVITLELPPEIEASLAAQAQARGLHLNVYVQSLLKQQAATEDAGNTMSPEQFEAELDALAAHSAKIPLLPLEALTREAIYRDHD